MPPDPRISYRWLALLALVIVAFFCLVSEARGWSQPQGLREVPIPTGLERVAKHYWGERGVTLPPHPELIEIADNPNAAGYGEMPGFRVWLVSSILSGDRRLLCIAYLHERGHNAGLGHNSQFQIMYDAWGHGPPPRCVNWAWV